LRTYSSGATPAAVEFALLQSWLASGSALQLALHEIECQQQTKGREVQRLLPQAHLQQRGNGDVGPALYLRQQDGEVAYSHRRLGTRLLTTVFGTVELVRMVKFNPQQSRMRRAKADLDKIQPPQKKSHSGSGHQPQTRTQKPAPTIRTQSKPVPEDKETPSTREFSDGRLTGDPLTSQESA